MPPLLFPAEPHFVNDSERVVWEALRDQLGDNDLLIANQVFTTRQRDYEVDLIVALENSGVVVIEVKGGRVWYEDDHWWQGRVSGPKRINLVDQVIGNKHVAQDWVHNSPTWGARTPLRWAHAVVLPDTDVDPRFGSPELSRQQVIDRGDLADIASKVRNLPLLLDTDRRLLEANTDLPAIHESLSARFAPTKDQFRQPANVAAENEQTIERLSRDQATILDALTMLNRVHVMGGAGTGKTWLAMEQARRLARKGQRVAVVGYSRGLAAWMQRRVNSFSHNEQPAYIGTFHRLAEHLGVEVDDTESDAQYWEEDLPGAIAEAFLSVPAEERFDAIVIDEAQDFNACWWHAALAALSHEDGGLYVFSDEGQDIFRRDGQTPEGLVPILLQQNIRNTRQISQTFNTLGTSQLRSSTHDGPDVRWIETDPENAVDLADDAVDGLIEEGWQPGDIAVLTTGRRHPAHDAQIEGQTTEEWDAYWETLWDKDDVFFGHVSGFKGLERPVVVLAINEQAGRDNALERLYVGLSRARDLLVVVSSADHLETVGGPAVLRKIRGD